MKIIKSPLLILIIIFSIITTNGVFASWIYSTDTAIEGATGVGTGITDWESSYYDGVVITSVTTISSNVNSESSRRNHPTKVNSTITGRSVQKIVYLATTIEEEVNKAVNSKLKNLDLLNDGDLTKGV